jgi:hypothetical protein
MAPFKLENNLKAGPFGRGGSLGPKTLNLQTEGRPPPPKPPGGFRVEDRIGIQAPAEVIWEIVYDIERWSDWNPTYQYKAGRIGIGEILTMTLKLPGQPDQEIRPKVLQWAPPTQLHWQLTMLGGMIKTLRYVEVDQIAEESCVVDNGELFAGLMGPSFAKRIGGSVRRGFHAMNEALKARAEEAWRTRKG